MISRLFTIIYSHASMSFNYMFISKRICLIRETLFAEKEGTPMKSYPSHACKFINPPYYD